MDFVELDRAFVSLNEEHERLSFGTDRFTWNDLLSRTRVVLLAEASAGKSAEFRARVEHLVAEGRHAFFLRIDDLADRGLEVPLQLGERQRFQSWLSGTRPAWFFLDSVDEARLIRREFERALKRFADEVGRALDRAHVYVSCRVSDWRGRADRAAINGLLQSSGRTAAPFEGPVMGTDQGLVEPIRSPRSFSGMPHKRPDETKVGDLLVVHIQPLEMQQMRRLAKSVGVGNTAEFIDVIFRNRLEALAERPGDLLELINYWRVNEGFGSFAEMVDHTICQKLSEFDAYRPDNDALSADKSRVAAERLAAAMTLAKTFAARAPAQELDPTLTEDALAPKATLPDLTEVEQNALLRRGLFAPATYGRIRFHHRSSQEYLTARWFNRLIRQGGKTVVQEYLFATRYGVDVVVPSLRAAGAWLALWDDDILEEVLRRDPLLLIEHGDPGSLPIEARRRMLRMFTARNREYAIGNAWLEGRMLALFADDRLAETIREMWFAHPDPGFRDHLLRLIGAGGLAACADLARNIASEGALYALAACGDGPGLIIAANAVREPTTDLPPRLLDCCIEVLFPDYLTVDEVVGVICRLPWDGDRQRNIAVRLARASSNLQPEVSDKLLEAIVTLCGSEPQADNEDGLSWRYVDFAANLDGILYETIAALGDREPSEHLIEACALFERAARSNKPLELAAEVQTCWRLNRALMWHDVVAARSRDRAALIDRHTKARPSFHQLWRLTATDIRWLRQDALERSELDDRKIAFGGLLEVSKKDDMTLADLPRLQDIARGQPELENMLGLALDPLKAFDQFMLDLDLSRRSLKDNDPKYAELEREWEERARLDAAAREERIVNYRLLARRLQMDPTALANEANLRLGDYGDLLLLRKWLTMCTAEKDGAIVDWRRLAQGFGSEVGTAYATAVKLIWRLSGPTIYEHEVGNAPADRLSSILSIDGLEIEAADEPRWIETLSPEEARLAAGHACVSYRDIPEWFGALAVRYPDVVAPVLGDELAREWTGASQRWPRLMYYAAKETNDVAPLVRHRLITLLAEWPADPNTLDRAIGIIARLHLQSPSPVSAAARRWFDEHCASGNHDVARAYLRLLFIVEPSEAVAKFESWIEASPPDKRDDLAALVLCSLFSYLNMTQTSPSRAGVDSLERLVRIAHRHIRYADDIDRDDVNNSRPRTDAQNARWFVLQKLGDVPGWEAHQALQRLAVELGDDRGRRLMQRMVYEHALKDAERPALTPAEVLRLERELILPVTTGQDLYQLIDRTLSEIVASFAHADASSRAVVATAADERAIQGWLAEQLRLRAHGRYHIHRESEVAEANRPDITVTSTEAQVEIAIEIKHGSKNWTIEALELGVRKQLAQDYLKSTTRRHGFFVITRHDDRCWRREDGMLIGFDELIGRLSALAATITSNVTGPVALKVVGIDATPIQPKRERRRRLRARERLNKGLAHGEME